MSKRSYHCLVDEHLHNLIAQGNYEAFEGLKKRYKRHALQICHDILSRYRKTGVSLRELMMVCDSCFLPIVKKFNSSLNSFFSFWKESTFHQIMGYLVDSGYINESDAPINAFSIDQVYEDKHPFSDKLCEKDDAFSLKRKIYEIKSIILQRKSIFTSQESTLLEFVLDGYTLGDLEHAGMLSKSTLYLTFKNAVHKLRKLLDEKKANRR